MSEGVGSTSIIVIIMVFIAFAASYMAYNVNYTKAFRMKNKIISTYEKYDGSCQKDCKDEIAAYAEEIGYEGININCSNNPYKPPSPDRSSNMSLSHKGHKMQFCSYRMVVDNKSSSSDDVVDKNKVQYYYRVVTSIDIQIPVIQNALQLRILNVTGDTKAFEKK